MAGETVLECLGRRTEILSLASLDDEYLFDLIDGFDSLDDLTTKQKEKLRMQCFYLKNAYKLAVQYMYELKWKDICDLAIKNLTDIGISLIKMKNN